MKCEDNAAIEVDSFYVSVKHTVLKMNLDWRTCVRADHSGRLV
jgi:uncharacterized lipoprotein YajG